MTEVESYEKKHENPWCTVKLALISSFDHVFKVNVVADKGLLITGSLRWTVVLVL